MSLVDPYNYYLDAGTYGKCIIVLMYVYQVKYLVLVWFFWSTVEYALIVVLTWCDVLNVRYAYRMSDLIGRSRRIQRISWQKFWCSGTKKSFKLYDLYRGTSATTKTVGICGQRLENLRSGGRRCCIVVATRALERSCSHLFPVVKYYMCKKSYTILSCYR
jgi:hypothetical protein